MSNTEKSGFNFNLNTTFEHKTLEAFVAFNISKNWFYVRSFWAASILREEYMLLRQENTTTFNNIRG